MDATRQPFAAIPGGWFTMGTDAGLDDEGPPHEVFVDAFELGVHPVTRAEYAVFLGATGHAPPCDWAQPRFDVPDLPVVGVSWFDAQAYCEWLGGSSGRAVRLPTEAEWEFAARGGGASIWPWGEGDAPEWTPGHGAGPLDAPWPVTLGAPFHFGLRGIACNVHEWCADWYDRAYYQSSPERNPSGPPRGVRRAARGGAWRHARTCCRATLRSKLDPSFRYNDFGFRVARAR
jgi:formylglycine-generating enzyme required for sulfatase activity